MGILKNKRGFAFLYVLMLAVVVILLALALAYPIKQVVDNGRTTMDCTNSSISNFYKGTCLFTDLTTPSFIGFLIFIAGAIIAAKIIGGNS